MQYGNTRFRSRMTSPPEDIGLSGNEIRALTARVIVSVGQVVHLLL
jgi:hypothetical protein